MINFIILLLFCLLSISCAITANRKGDKLILRGYGAKSASWEKDGEKYSIEKSEPIKVPEIINKD